MVSALNIENEEICAREGDDLIIDSSVRMQCLLMNNVSEPSNDYETPVHLVVPHMQSQKQSKGMSFIHIAQLIDSLLIVSMITTG